LTIKYINGKIRFYNKSKEISAKSPPFINSYISLATNEFFLNNSRYTFHGEAIKSVKHNTIEYNRVPRYHWILYEVYDEITKQMLLPEQIKELISCTKIEYIEPWYDNRVDKLPNISYREIVDEFMEEIKLRTRVSCLGGIPEGLVFKVVNRLCDNSNSDGNDNNNDNNNGNDNNNDCNNDNDISKGNVTNTRLKFVREEFSEMNHSKKGKIQTLSDSDFIKSIGQIYNTDARIQKGIQHLQEADEWDYIDETNNDAKLEKELDEDLLKEGREDIENYLFVRFWDSIRNASRLDLKDYLLGKSIPDRIDTDYVVITFNNIDRFEKAINILKKENRWNSDKPITNMNIMVNVLDDDLLLYGEKMIKQYLFEKYWDTIKLYARK
jgi:hypothetical protein